MSMEASRAESLVVFPLGERRFALPTTDVVELSRAGSVQSFPHTTPGALGVIVRRGEVLPVLDIAQALDGTKGATRKFFLVVQRNFAGREPTALMISGECQMRKVEVLPPLEGAAAHIRGFFWQEGEAVEVLDLGLLAPPPRQSNRQTLEGATEGERT